LSEPSFYSWRRRFQRRLAERSAFVAVNVAGNDRPAQAGVLELVLGNGRVVRVEPGFDAATLRRLLAVLEEGRPC
jgi:hypothetical protein